MTKDNVVQFHPSPGAGKTYTMMGTDKDPGVNIRSILELLRVCDERTTVDYSMCVSMVEVYNETVRDLLSESSGSQHLNIQMRNKQLVITDVTEIEVKLAADIKSIMEKGKEQFFFILKDIILGCSGESTRLPPLWPGFDSQTRRHMWVEFVGSLLCTERFSPGTPVSPLLKNQH